MRRVAEGDAASPSVDLRQRALIALALNRTPGFHFIGNFLGVTFEEITTTRARVALAAGEYCEDLDGRLDLSAVTLLADVALASVVRANLTPAQRLATVTLNLQFTGAQLIGPLTGSGEFAGFLHGAHGRQGLSRATVDGGAGELLVATGAFMVLDPPPGVTMHPLVSADHTRARPLAEKHLSHEERRILARVAAAAAGHPNARGFLQRFWDHVLIPDSRGATGRFENGPHIGNRVGHVQGGLQVGFAATTAIAALPADWLLSGLTACFVSPGEGRALRATARVVHRGRQTGVVQTTLTGKHGRRVLEVLSTHAWRALPAPAARIAPTPNQP